MIKEKEMNRKQRMKKRLLPLFAALILLALSGCDLYLQDHADGFLVKPQQTQEVSVPEQTQTQEVPAPEQTQETEQVQKQDEKEAPPEEENKPDQQEEQQPEADLPKQGEAYYDLENVVLYLELYGGLPDNYIGKNEARNLGWEGGSVEDFQEGAAIGGDRFGNREGILPKNNGQYLECDIDTKGRSNRGARRLIYTKQGSYYYTDDHYESFREVLVGPDYTVSFGKTLQ